MLNFNKITLWEVLLFQVIVWLSLWVFNDYLAMLLTLSIGAMVFAVLIIALISEWIEPTKVPGRYFQVMWISLLSMIISYGIFWALKL